MNLTDTQSLSGEFALRIYRDGAIADEIVEPNLIVNGALGQLAHLIGGAGTNRHITHIGFGTGTGAASPDNTGLTGAFWKPITAVTYPATGHTSFSWSLSTAEANGMSITEFGLRCADNVLFARKVRSAIVKDSDLSLTGTWTIKF